MKIIFTWKYKIYYKLFDSTLDENIIERICWISIHITPLQFWVTIKAYYSYWDIFTVKIVDKKHLVKCDG